MLAKSWYGHAHIQLAGLTLVAVALGGGGSRQGLLNLAVQLAAFAVLAFNRSRAARFLREAPRGLLILIGLTLALPLLQLIPLPPAIWMRLPGRGVVVQSLTLIGAQGAWMPFSLDPNRTAVALVAVIACLPFAILSATLERARAHWVPSAIVTAGCLSVALGALQLAQGNRGMVVDPRGVMRSQLYATFANHNASGLFFVLCLVCMTMLRFDWLKERLKGRGQPGSARSRAEAARTTRLARIVIGGVFALCTILSQSRSSIVILAMVLAWLAWRSRALLMPAKGSGRTSRDRRVAVLAGAGLAALVLALGILAAHTSTLQNSFSRFESVDDAREEIWADTVSAIRRYVPVGAGIGSFDEVFQLDESLENLASGQAGRAHNDYLEVLVESGIAGIALVLGWMAWIVLQGRRAGTLAMGAAGVLACLALQSFIDYPLRNMAMLAIASSMIGLLARRRESPPATSEDDGEPVPTALPKVLLWWGSIGALAVAALFLQFDIQSVRTPSFADKVPVLFQSRSATILAQRAIADQDWGASPILAARTILRRPVPASSLSTLALSRARGGAVYDDSVIGPMMQASSRGWRDPFAQVAAIALAMETGKTGIAAQRVDALWRVGEMNSSTQEAAKAALADPAVREALAARYAAGAGWSSDFIDWGATNLPPDQFTDVLAKAAAKGAPMDCAAISLGAARMLVSGQPESAVRIWNSLCGRRYPSSAKGPVPLVPQAAITGPFDWTYPPGPSLDRQFQRGGRVQYQGYDLVRGQLARRYAYLASGEHVLSADIAGMAPVLTVSCIADGRPARPTEVTFVAGKARFTLPDTNCAVQQILLEVSRGTGTIGNLILN